MNGKRLYREFAISRGKDCKSFVKVEQDYYNEVLHYKDSGGADRTMTFIHKDMVHWLISSFSNKVWDHFKGGSVDELK